MEALRPVFERYDRILIFDTETTGLRMSKDEIIQFSGVLVEPVRDTIAVTREYDALIQLAPGQKVPPDITRLTGIRDEDLAQRGITRNQACREIQELISGNTLLAAYNAHFDLVFLFHMLCRNADPGILQGKDKLDLLTVYRDRKRYPHRLANAIEAYGLSGQVQNSHSAIEDALATVSVMNAMAAEKNDLLNYVNLFGYIPKYGPPKPQIRSVTYRPQPYDPIQPLYCNT